MNEKQQEVYGIIQEDRWIVQKKLLEILKLKYDRNYKSRALRQIIKDCRMLYKENKVSMLIIKSNRGYKLSNNYDEICRFANELINTGDSMRTEGRELLEAAEKNNVDVNVEKQESRCIGIEEYCQDSIRESIKGGCFSHLQLIEITKCITAGIAYADILMLATSEMHPYVMFLTRKGLLEGLDRKVIRLYADVTLATVDVYKLYRAATNGCSVDKIINMKKEMRDVESKKTDQR